MSLFKPVSAGGNFYRPKAGQYLGTLVRHEDGGMGKDFGDGKPPKPLVRWKWELKHLDGTPVLQDGQQVTVDALAPAQPTLKNKTAAYFQAHIKRPIKTDDDVDQLAQESIGKTVMLVYTGDGETSKLSAVLPYN